MWPDVVLKVAQIVAHKSSHSIFYLTSVIFSKYTKMIQKAPFERRLWSKFLAFQKSTQSGQTYDQMVKWNLPNLPNNLRILFKVRVAGLALLITNRIISEFSDCQGRRLLKHFKKLTFSWSYFGMLVSVITSSMQDGKHRLGHCQVSSMGLYNYIFTQK